MAGSTEQPAIEQRDRHERRGGVDQDADRQTLHIQTHPIGDHEGEQLAAANTTSGDTSNLMALASSSGNGWWMRR